MAAFTPNLIMTNWILHNAAVVEFHEKQASLSADTGQQIIFRLGFSACHLNIHRQAQEERKRGNTKWMLLCSGPTHLFKNK